MKSDRSTASTQTCDVLSREIIVAPFCLLLFGGAGDLSQRMLLPALYYLYTQENLFDEFSIVGVGLPAYSDEEYRRVAKEAILAYSTVPVNEMHCDAFVQHLYYLSGSFDSNEVYRTLCDKVNTAAPFLDTEDSNLVYYCAVPPSVLPVIASKLNAYRTCPGVFNTKIVVEKPFGMDRSSAVDLNRALLKQFDEKQIYRIDHYLGKDTVQNIIFFRFGNSIFEPLWDRRYIDHIQITVAEDIGMEHRGPLYERVGVVRDIVQNHIMQLIALIAMEPPIGFDPDLIRDEKTKVLRTVRIMDAVQVDAMTVVGQYGPGTFNGQEVPGYRHESGVNPDSHTPTFFAGVFYIDNWRWADVPIYVRTGKRLKTKSTEIYIEFKQPPLRLFKNVCEEREPNALILSIQPQEELAFRLSVKRGGIATEPHLVQMKFNYPESFKIQPHPSYERQILDFLQGDLTLFIRQEGVEATWSIVDPIIKKWDANPPKNFPNYMAGSWGPDEAKHLIERDGRKWHYPDDY